MAPPDDKERELLAQRRAELATKYVKPPGERPQSNARGIHHAALICSDVEQTIKFYDGVLGFPLVEITENRDYPGSSHFFFDLGNSTLLGFFDFPGLGLQPAEERIGTVQHIAIGVVDEAVTDPGAGRERGQVAGHHAVQVAVDPGVDLALDDIDELFLVLLGVGP